MYSITGFRSLATTCIMSLALCSGAPNAALAEEPQARSAATTPAPRTEEWWTKRLEKANELARQGDIDLVFVGDSITQGWESSGKAVWEKYYSHRKALNLGFSGDRTQHVLWRLDHGNIDGIAPKVVVVMIGTNNVDSHSNAEQIAQGVKAIVARLREKLPKAKILLLGIFPRGEAPNPGREQIAEINTMIKKSAESDDMVRYLDIGAMYVQPDGHISKDIMPDYLHLNPVGYEMWAKAIEPALAEMLGDKPIGDGSTSSGAPSGGN